MRKMQSGDEVVDISAVEASFVDALGNDLADKVLARARPTMQGEGQRLLRIRIVQKARDGFHNHLLHQVLPKELLVQLLLKH